MYAPTSIRFLSLLGVLTIVGGIFYTAHPEKFDVSSLQTALSKISLSSPKRTDATAQKPSLASSHQDFEEDIAFSGEIPTHATLDPTTNQRLQQLLMTEEASVTDQTQTLNAETLLQYFQKTKDPQLINSIVREMLDTYRFTQAKQFIQSLTPTQKTFLDPHLDIQVAFNSFQLSSTSGLQDIAIIINQYASAKAITTEEATRYNAIIALTQREYEKFFELAQQFSSSSYRGFADTITKLKAQVEQPGDQPAYYLDALVAVELFNQGFFYPAKVLSLHALFQNASYILPYQILAYSNFFTSSRDAAIGYFSTLKTLDEAQYEKYTFLMGVAYYRNKQYEYSVLHLNQIKKDNPTFYADAQRYALLDYLALKQRSKALELRETLFKQKEITLSDFFTYFDYTFFKPYAKGEPYTIYQENPMLAKQYVLTCEQLFVNNSVCAYGKIGLSLVENTNLNLEEELLQLVEQYPQGYLYQLLGDLYRRQGKSEDAKFYLLKAMGMSENEAQTYQIKNLLQKVL